MKPPGARLYALLARETPVGVIFRRGPSRQTLLIRWDTANDTFETGQWFKGRLFERRSDLSPDGSRLIYFAANYKQPHHAWTAISRPPYLTALALWPKLDTYNGGGQFVTANELILNHEPWQRAMHPDFIKIPVRVAGYAEWRGEDDSVQKPLLVRDGWKLIDRGRWESFSAKAGGGFAANPPELWRKPHPAADLALETALVSIGRKQGAFYCWKFRVVPARQPEGEAAWNSWDWADWDKQGDLVYAQRGALYRQPVRGGLLEPARLLADFTGMKFEEVQAPEWATFW